MKKTRIYIGMLLLSAGTFTACDNFLSEVPDNRTQLTNKETISELLVSAYPGGTYAEFAETMSDNVFDSGNLPNTTPTNTENFNWEVVQEIDGDTPSYYWDACYTAIAAANQALQAIEKLGDTPDLQGLKSEALLARAYNHFMLLQFWAPAYNPETADTDLGIPYVTEPEEVLIKDYKRNTVAEVFEFLEADIEEGLKGVTNQYIQPKFHFNVDAAKAFASRFYLMKGDWNRVLELSSKLAGTPNTIRDYAAWNSLGIYEMMSDYAKVEHQTNLLIATQYSVYGGRSISSNRFNLTGADLDEYFSRDLNPYGKDWRYRRVSSNGNITVFVPKFDEYFKVTNPNAGIGYPFVTYVLLSNDELFLNRIEAHVMTNDFDSAVKELGYFIGKRTEGYNALSDKLTIDKVKQLYPVIEGELTPFYDLSADQIPLLKAVLDNRRREFVHEGLRWLDIKRFEIVVNRFRLNEIVPYNTLEKKDNRRLVQIPQHVSDRGIEKNPR